MKKYIFIVLILQYFMLTVSAQPEAGRIDSSLLPGLKMHYQQEFTLDVAVDPSRWQKEKSGLHAAFGSTNAVYFRTDVPEIHGGAKVLEATGWRGERINANIIVWSPDTIGQVRFIVSDLKSASGHVLSKKNLQLNMVRYVISNYPYDAREVT